MRYKTVICGGTFDFLHQGHKAFISFAFSQADHVVIGVTSDAYTQKHKQSVIQPYALREKNLKDFLEKEHLIARAEILPIDDIYGPALKKDFAVDAIVVTNDTVQGARTINTERKKIGLSELPLCIAPLITSEGNIISSSTIRENMTDAEGNPYIRQFWLQEDHILPETFRPEVAKVFGDIVTDMPHMFASINPATTVTVGDVTTKLFHDNGIFPKIAVVDFKIERKDATTSLPEIGFSGKEKVLTIVNPSGTITASLWQTIIEIVNHISEEESIALIIKGEEDLAALPFVLALPFGFSVFYGQPHEGLVEVKITKATKEKANAIVSQFEAKTTRGY